MEVPRKYPDHIPESIQPSPLVLKFSMRSDHIIRQTLTAIGNPIYPSGTRPGLGGGSCNREPGGGALSAVAWPRTA